MIIPKFREFSQFIAVHIEAGGTGNVIEHMEATSLLSSAHGQSDAALAGPSTPLTPPHRWFSPSAGWPSPNHPPLLQPPIPTPPHAVGTLEVEVLSASRLPWYGKSALEVLDIADAYAVVIFETYAARTCTIWNKSDPVWPPDCDRAFRFPITCPHATLCVGLMDNDSYSTDDNIGRVEIELGGLHGRTVYEMEYNLQYHGRSLKTLRRGSIRLRLSVSYPSDRARFFAAMTQPSLSFVVEMASPEAAELCRFTAFGRRPHALLSPAYLEMYLEESMKMALAIGETLRLWLFWRPDDTGALGRFHPLFNTAIFVLYQVAAGAPVPLHLTLAYRTQPYLPIRTTPFLT